MSWYLCWFQVIAENLSEDEIAGLFAAFQYFDKDGSGYITADELQLACEEFGLGDVQLEEMIREVDEDNDGRIDYNEFVAMMQKPTMGLPAKKSGGLQNSFSIGFREALRMSWETATRVSHTLVEATTTRSICCLP
jgi:hypothetical protein